MRRFLLLVFLLALGGCTTTVMPAGDFAAVAPMLSVERFLRAANAQDLHSMARIFGTADGPNIETGGALGCGFRKFGSWFGIGDRCRTIQEVEVHMDLISQIVRHEDYTIVSESSVPGRTSRTSRVGVNMRVRGEDIENVGFVVVQTGEGRWLIEQIELERITGGEAPA